MFTLPFARKTTERAAVLALIASSALLLGGKASAQAVGNPDFDAMTPGVVAGVMAPAEHQNDDVYFLAQLTVDDWDAFGSAYFPPVTGMLMETGVRVLFASPQPEVLEGEWASNWTVLLRFDDRASFDAFYTDTNYVENILPIRLGAASVNNVVLLEPWSVDDLR